MPRLCALALFVGMVLLSGGLTGQETKKDDPKKDDKASKKDDTPAKAKGTLPANWKKLGLTDAQVQDIYKIQGKYSEEIEKLDSKIKELKGTRDKEEMRAILTADQKKRLEEIVTGKDK